MELDGIFYDINQPLYGNPPFVGDGFAQFVAALQETDRPIHVESPEDAEDRVAPWRRGSCDAG